MFKRESLVTLRNLDKEMYDKPYNAVMEIHGDIKAMSNPAASAEDRAIATVSNLDDLDRFAAVFSDASKSYKKHTGEFLSSKSIPGLKYRTIRLDVSRQLFRSLTDFRKSIMMGRNRRQAVCKRRRGYGQGVMGIAKCGFIASFFVAVKKKEREK
ncbi:hypothetical protein ADH76_03565 [Enterocloster clostridioformis]|uniref:hypothetical protein n=1 Tax=Enterocloster clostridioformis TaxID=1531 RepID=UPI00080CAEE3|nr:hypothetical protein [Enterocloster clostridioformis]ANU44613.1 hypothetical protein A4V08_01035 [Lachnoclostridium sp. YL32]NDO28022.1 hypothetical protein [Enterocloster clostridioformis]OXE70477.1 hypothetical protein ADH76_03565 [Enterocloster clostridioformis]QQR00630.1 hypothetical protein I5Q83_33620 [Enterocloster clostridioformis]